MEKVRASKYCSRGSTRGVEVSRAYGRRSRCLMVVDAVLYGRRAVLAGDDLQFGGGARR